MVPKEALINHILILLVLIPILISCNNIQSNTVMQEQSIIIDDTLIITNNGIGNLIIGLSLDNIKSQGKYIIKDTLLEDETTWPAKSLYLNKQLLALLEANWLNDSIISRIVILSKDILTEDGITIGMTFGKIKNKISTKIPTVPDGYLSLTHKQNNNIFFEMDLSNIDKESKLYYGAINSLDEIPDTLKIKYILIM